MLTVNGKDRDLRKILNDGKDFQEEQPIPGTMKEIAGNDHRTALRFREGEKFPEFRRLGLDNIVQSGYRRIPRQV
jgi:hypothetical protein